VVTILTVAGLDISLFLRMNNFAVCLRFFTFVVASLRKHLIGKLHVVMTVLMISRDFLVTLNGHFWNVSEERSSVEFCSQEFVVMTINAFSYSHSCNPIVKP